MSLAAVGVELEASRELLRVLRDDGRSDPAHDPFLPQQVLRVMYREMRRIRLLDRRMVALQRQGRVGFYGACTGQEAVPVAAGLAARTSDWVFPALRESSILLVRGFPLDRYVAQVFGNRLDVLKGRQMPSHMSARAKNLVSWSSCIATQLPHAVGAAWAARRLGHDTIALAFCGDGATSEGDFHAAMNFAAVMKSPCVIVCQNNQWSISTPSSRQTASETFAVKAEAYGIPSARVDGNDVLAVYRAVSEACDAARSGRGPRFIECVTYRIDAHSTSDDPSRYRSEAEVREWARKDPIDRMRRYLAEGGFLDEAEARRLDDEIEAEIERAITSIEAAPPPETESLFEDVYASPPWHLCEQRDELLRAVHPGRSDGRF